MTARRALIPALALCFLAPTATARNDFIDYEIARVAQSDVGKQKIKSVPYYFAGQKHPGVAKELGEFTANRRANAFGRSDDVACRSAFISALVSLQDRAVKQGGNAVVGIRSITKNNDLSSASRFRCAAGNAVANVALKGRVVRLK